MQRQIMAKFYITDIDKEVELKLLGEHGNDIMEQE